MPQPGKTHHRSVFVSDIHLGSPMSQTGRLLEFLDKTKCDNLYIVGDFIDFFHLYEHHGWAAECNLVIRKIFSKVRKGTSVKICVGNHDAFVGLLNGFSLGQITIGKSFVHKNKFIDYLVTHGDEFDNSLRFSGLVKVLCFMYMHLHWVPFAKRLKWVSDRVSARNIDYERMKRRMEENGCMGCVFGHTHFPEVPSNGSHLLNCGDWVEHCSAIVETMDGEMKIVCGREP